MKRSHLGNYHSPQTSPNKHPEPLCGDCFGTRRAAVNRLIVVAIVIIAIGLIAAAYFSPYLLGAKSGSETDHLVKTFATRSPFRITVNGQGSLDSQKNAVLSSQVPGHTTIISILAEGTTVKKGDIVCQLDSSSLEDKAKQQQISVTQAKSAFANAKENLAIQKTLNESNIAAAKLKWELAKLDFEKYTKGELEQERNKLKGQITLKKEELTRSNETLDFTKRMVRKGYRSQSDLEAQQLAVSKAEIELKVQQETRDVLNKYTARRKTAELTANAAESERELDRVKRKAKAAIIKTTADLEARKLTLEVENEKETRWLQQIKDCKLIAPQDGKIIHANQKISRRGSSEILIEEGAQVRQRQAIINLPDLTLMKVDARIHSTLRDRLEVGQTVLIRVSENPNKIYNGMVDRISSVPLPGSWPNYDVKEYAVTINLTDSPRKIADLKTGSTVEFEIISSHREAILQIPIQAVVNIGTKYYAYTVTNDSTKRVEIKIGTTNDVNVEILSGLEEGTEVVLNPRSAFKDELDKLEDELGSPQKSKTTRKKKTSKSKSKPKEKKPESKKKSLDQLFNRFDANGDGTLQQEELPSRMQSQFKKFDADKDGAISKQEFKKVRSGSGRGKR